MKLKKIISSPFFGAWLCFAIVLSFYIMSLSPGLPPYRDSGELIVGASTLSISHSPGYPLYMILGKAAVEIASAANIPPALAMNLFSALCGAFAVFFIFLFIYKLGGSGFAAAFGAFATGFSYMNWYLSVVAEMYSLNLMLIAAVLYLFSEKKYMAASFTAGLALGNHLTSLFAMIPVFLYGYFKKRKKADIKKNFFFSAWACLFTFIFLSERFQTLL